MPPWSSRLLSPNSRNEPGPNSADGNSPSPARARSRLTETDILENAYGIPSLPPPPHSSFGASRSSKPTRNGSHGRSMSHPFPSLFSSKKKRPGENVAAGYESTDDDRSSTQARNTPHKSVGKQRVPGSDLLNGNCMTCDSMVRWPKELKSFRCSVCLMINDLKPVILETRRGDGHRSPVSVKPGTYPGASLHPKGMFDAIRWRVWTHIRRSFSFIS